MLRSPVKHAAGESAQGAGVIVGASYHNDESPPLGELALLPPIEPLGGEREANENPRVPSNHRDSPDEVVQNGHVSEPSAMPATILNFNGIPFPGVACSCAPPDTDGEVGLTQYVQIVNEGYQVFNKTTGASVLGPVGIASIWTGFGAPCETAGHGDPIVLYDQLANRWLISQFAGTSIPTDECIAISTTADATGSYFRYGFHLGSNFFDYPHIAVWPDAYYMSDNVFNPGGTAFLGPQPFAFDRAKMLAGLPATFVSPGITVGPTENPYHPADLDGSNLPAAGAPATFVEWPGGGTYKVFHFHADFATPGLTTFTLFASPAAAGFTELCPATRACIPQLGSATNLDGIGDRLMHRLAYRKFGDGHESVVGNFTVSSGGVAGIRWFELRNVTAGPVTVFQDSTYQPDSSYRWMGSVSQDQQGNLALGFSTSSSTINPQIRYAGRLATDPINTLGQGEAHLFDGTGSQTATGSRWGDYSAMSVDPVDDCTFWYTQEYYATTSSFNWRTRIGSFKFPTCGAITPTPTATPTNTRTNTPTNTPTQTPTSTRTNTPANTPTRTPTSTPTSTPTNTPTPTTTPTNPPTSTPTNTPTNTPTRTPTSTPTSTPTNTPTPMNTATPTNTSTNPPTNTPTNTPSNTPTQTPTNVPTNTPTDTPTNPPTATNTPTNTPTNPPTATNTPTNVPTNHTPTSTRTNTPSRTPTNTRTNTPTRTPTRTATNTRTNTPTITPTNTPTQTNTPATGTPTPKPVVTPPLTDFRDVRRPPDINAGPDLGGTGHQAMNFTGSVGAGGDTWITVYDETPADDSVKNVFGNVILSADVLIHTYNNKKGAGLLALFNEGAGQKGLALIVYDSGNGDSLVLGTVNKATGLFTPLTTVSLGANITENAWYRLTMEVAVSGSNVTVTGTVFRHTTATDPNSPTGTQVGGTLTFSGALPAGVDATGEIGIAAQANSAAVDSSVTNFTIDP